MKHHNLEEFAGGKLSAQVNKALEQVMENIMDPNTDAKKVRKISVSISFKANDDRNFIATAVETKTALAPEIGAVTALSVGKDLRSGEVECVEIANQIPGQLSFHDTEEITQQEETQDFDPDTGEIYEAGSNVVDLRKKQA